MTSRRRRPKGRPAARAGRPGRFSASGAFVSFAREKQGCFLPGCSGKMEAFSGVFNEGAVSDLSPGISLSNLFELFRWDGPDLAVVVGAAIPARPCGSAGWNSAAAATIDEASGGPPYGASMSRRSRHSAISGHLTLRAERFCRAPRPRSRKRLPRAADGTPNSAVRIGREHRMGLERYGIRSLLAGSRSKGTRACEG